MERDERGDVEVGEHVTVGDDERLVDARRVGGEADRAGGVERLRLDGVVQPRAGARSVGERVEERLRLEAEGERDVGDAAANEVGDEPFDDRPVTDRQHRLRDAEA